MTENPLKKSRKAYSGPSTGAPSTNLRLKLVATDDPFPEGRQVHVTLAPVRSDEVVRDCSGVNPRPRRSQVPRKESAESRGHGHRRIAALRIRIEYHSIPVKPSRIVERILARVRLLFGKQQHRPMPLRLRLNECVDVGESLPAIGTAVHQYVVSLRIMIGQQHRLGIFGIERGVEPVGGKIDLQRRAPLRCWQSTGLLPSLPPIVAVEQLRGRS